MSHTIVFDSKVEVELRRGFDHYEQLHNGLGFEFLLSVEAALYKIGKDPLLFSKVYKNKRKANLKRFPYGVFYIVSKGTVLVLAVIQLTPDAELNPEITGNILKQKSGNQPD